MLQKIRNLSEKKLFLVVGILIIGALAFRVGRADVSSDSATYLYRAWGYVDYMSSKLQTTPLQWFPIVHWWQHLSFHDAPPLAFMCMWFFLNISGASITVVRFGSVLLGSVGFFILWLAVFKKVGAKNSWLWLLTLFSITPLVAILRVSMLESWFVTWIILGFAFFFLAESHAKNFIWSALFFGLACLTKYTIAPLLLGPFLWFILHPSLFKKREVQIGGLIFIALLSPVVIYNIMMTLAIGHPDLQISTALHLNTTAQWKQLSHGVHTGFFEAFKEFFISTFPLTSLLLLLSAGFVSLRAWRTRTLIPVTLFGGLCGACIQLYLTGIAGRFLVPLYIVLAWCAALTFIEAKKIKNKKLVIAFFVSWGICVAGGSLATITTVYAKNPSAGPFLIKSVRETDNGWNEIDGILRTYLDQKQPAALTNMWGLYNENQGLRSEFQRVQQPQGHDPFPGLIVYDSRVPWFQRLWYFERWNLYRQFAVVSTVEYYGFTVHDPQYFVRLGFDPKLTSYIYATQFADGSPELPLNVASPISDTMRDFFEHMGAPKKEIKDETGAVHFVIYGPLAQ